MGCNGMGWDSLRCGACPVRARLPLSLKPLTQNEHILALTDENRGLEWISPAENEYLLRVDCFRQEVSAFYARAPVLEAF